MNTNTIQQLKEEVLTELIFNEFVEVVVPIGFIGSFAMAYYGPNKIKYYGRYKKVEDLSVFLIPVAEMALIDSGSVILAGILLWPFCCINLWKEYCKTMKNYWITFALRGAFVISFVSIFDINVCKILI